MSTQMEICSFSLVKGSEKLWLRTKNYMNISSIILLSNHTSFLTMGEYFAHRNEWYHNNLHSRLMEMKPRFSVGSTLKQVESLIKSQLIVEKFLITVSIIHKRFEVFAVIAIQTNNLISINYNSIFPLRNFKEQCILISWFNTKINLPTKRHGNARNRLR